MPSCCGGHLFLDGLVARVLTYFLCARERPQVRYNLLAWLVRRPPYGLLGRLAKNQMSPSLPVTVG